MEKMTFRVFTASMLSCAASVLVGIWLGERAPETLFKVAATFFIIGFASFLIWSPILAYRFLERSR